MAETNKAKIQEELAYLRQKCNSLALRGSYSECVKVIESNIKLLYFQERYPENFCTMLRIHKKCYPSLGHAQSYEDYTGKLLERNGIPTIYTRLLKESGKSAWSAEHFRNQAIASKNAQQLEEALGYCDVALKIEPHSSNTALLRGWILQDLGRDGDAREMFEQAVELNETNFQAGNSLARQYLRESPKRALEYVQKAIDAHPEEASFYATRGYIRCRTGDREGAVKDYDEAISLDPYSGDYHFEKGELLLESDMEMAALAAYRKVLAVNDRHVPALLRLATLLEKNQPNQALDYMNTAVHQQPENLQVQLLRARLCLRTGDRFEAVRQYKAILQAHENHAGALSGLGQALLREDAERALECFSKAAALEPGNAEHHMGMAEAHRAKGNQAAAVQEYEKALGIDRENARAHAELGGLLSKEKPETALQHMAKACQLEPKNPYYHTDRGLLLSRLGRRGEALQSLSKAAELDPANGQLHTQLGDLLDADNKRASAIRHYQQAAHMSPDLPGAHFGLTRLLINTEPHVALVHINAAIHLTPANGQYYFTKAQVLFALSRNERMEILLREAQEQERKAEDQKMVDEIELMIGGEILRMALYYVDRAIEQEPQISTYVCLRAKLLGAMGQWKKALDQYEQLIKIDPNNHEALFGIGCILAERKDKKAVEYIDRAIKLEPAVSAYHGGKASLLSQDPARYQEAVESYAMATQLDHYAWELLLDMARLMDAHGDIWGAQGAYRKALLIHRDCLPAAARMAELLAERKPRPAMSYVEHCIGLDPENPLYHAVRAGLLYKTGEEEAAEAECELALELGVGDAQTLMQLAQALWQAAPEKALQYALQAAEKGELGAQIHMLCARILREMGEYVQAEQCCRRAAAASSGLHEAGEQIAQLLFIRRDPGTLEAVEAALEQQANCPACLYLKACALDELEPERLPEALEAAALAVELSPDLVEYRQKLVELLQKKRSHLRCFKEKRRLEKVLRAQEQARLAEQDADEIDFTPEKEDETEENAG